MNGLFISAGADIWFIDKKISVCVPDSDKREDFVVSSIKIITMKPNLLIFDYEAEAGEKIALQRCVYSGPYAIKYPPAITNGNDG